MRRIVACLGFAAVAIAAVPFVLVQSSPTHASAETATGPATILIPASDGYDLGECLGAGQACGKVIADAWCGAHGYGPALSFAAAKPEDVTAGIEPVSIGGVGSREAPAILVTCRN